MRFFFSLAASLLISTTALPVFAQPAGAIGENFIYLVRPGDTLSNLSELYTTRTDQWRPLKELNNVTDELALPVGKELKIPFSMIPVVATEAKLTHTKGQVWINGHSAKQTETLQTGDVIRTGNNGFATLQLEDHSTITLPNNSELVVKQLNAFERAHLTDAILELNKGAVEGRIAPDNQGVGRFEIHTPQSVTGVRGTSLRVRTQSTNTQTELLTGKAMLNSEQATYMPLAMAHGATVSADGSYSVNQLLAAPVLNEPVRGRQGWESVINQNPEAEYYVVQITLDADGADIVQSYTVAADQTNIPLRSNGAGQQYAFVRAVDHNGLMGLDASVAFLGQSNVVSSDGNAVISSNGQPLLLTDY